jgi:hypothetical protein
MSTLLKILLVLSILCLLVSLTQPAFYIDRPNAEDAWANSLYIFFLGWTSLLGGAADAYLIWQANPLYIAAVIFTLKRNKLALLFSGSATFTAFVFLFLPRITASVTGATSAITERLAGYWLWFISFILLTIGLAIEYFRTRKME